MAADTPEDVIKAAQADPFTQAAVDAGATPAPVDYDALLKNIAAMQAKISSLEAERGIPSDPIAAHVKNLVDHVAARSASVPSVDMGVVKEALSKLPEDSAQVNSKATAYVKELVHNMVDKFKAHEFGYLRDLASDLHLEVLKQEAAV